MRKILWHKRFDNAQLGIFVKRAHVVLQETGDIVWGHVRGFLGRNALSGPGVLAAPGTVCLFLATIAGLVSFDFAVEALPFFHKFRFLGFGVLLASSQNVGVDVHGVSSLRGGASSIVVSSSTVIFGWGLPGGYSEGLEESLLLLLILGGGFPFMIG